MNWKNATLGQLYEIAYNDDGASPSHKRAAIEEIRRKTRRKSKGKINYKESTRDEDSHSLQGRTGPDRWLSPPGRTAGCYRRALGFQHGAAAARVGAHMAVADKRQRQLERLLQIAEDKVAAIPTGAGGARLTSAVEERDRVRQQLEDYIGGQKSPLKG